MRQSVHGGMEMSEMREFLKAVWKQWKSGLTGGALVALLVVYQATGRSVSAWFYAVIVVVTVFHAFFLTWRYEYRGRKDAEARLLSSGDRQLLETCRNLSSRFMELMRRFPSSPAIADPFGKTWRPLVGTTNFGEDVREVLRWHGDCQAFLGELEKGLDSKNFGDLMIVQMIRNPMSYLGALDWLKSLYEIPWLLLRKVME